MHFLYLIYQIQLHFLTETVTTYLHKTFFRVTYLEPCAGSENQTTYKSGQCTSSMTLLLVKVRALVVCLLTISLENFHMQLRLSFSDIRHDRYTFVNECLINRMINNIISDIFLKVLM